MTERENLYAGISYAAWGYLFLYVDFNLGTVSILPRFVGYLLFLAAIGKLGEKRRDLELLRPLGMLLAVWNIADWMASWLGTTVDGWFLPLDLIVNAVGLYFHFQMFTDFAALAAEYQGPDGILVRRLLHWRTVQAVLTTVAAVAYHLMERLDGMWTYGVLTLALIQVIVAICLMAALFSLRKLFREELWDEEPPPAGEASQNGR